MRARVQRVGWVLAALLGVTACVGDSAQPSGDAGAACPGSETKCGDQCTDTTRDPANCGACGTACSAGTLCSSGACVANCPASQTACSGACVDTTRDSANCGKCGNACGPHMQCASSACAPVVCATNADCDDKVACNGVETCDPQSPEANAFGCVSAFADGGAGVDAGYLKDDDHDGLIAATQCGGTDCDDTKYGFGLGDWADCGTCGHACGVDQACQAGQCVAARRVFVTSAGFNANLGGVAGADADCQSAANAAKLGGTWMAYIFDAGHTQARLEHATVPYVRLDGVKIADDWTALTKVPSKDTDPVLSAPLSITELRTPASSGNVWTGLSSGSLGTTCNSWTDGAADTVYGQAGEFGQVSVHWGGYYLFSCASAYRLYCIEQP